MNQYPANMKLLTSLLLTSIASIGIGAHAHDTQPKLGGGERSL